MTDFFEIDFLPVETKKSGDAITARYSIDGVSRIHVIDGGFEATGDQVVAHINGYYDGPSKIDHVVVTHPDGDHARGLRTVLETYEIGSLWILRPWLYADQLLPNFKNLTSVEHLVRRLRDIYPNLAALEEIALSRGIPMYEPFQGQMIGAFTVLAPSRSRYLNLVLDSEKTPEALQEAAAESLLTGLIRKVSQLLRAAWGEEVFSTNETSAENEMSVVQYAQIAGKKILLTGDAGRAALSEAADYAPLAGLILPGIDRFQIPHHGSRRNVSTELLDRWLGERQATQGNPTFSAIVSSAKEDAHHPRNSVVRAFIHRGASVLKTEGKAISTFHGIPLRAGWVTATSEVYPEEQEA